MDECGPPRGIRDRGIALFHECFQTKGGRKSRDFDWLKMVSAENMRKYFQMTNNNEMDSIAPMILRANAYPQRCTARACIDFISRKDAVCSRCNGKREADFQITFKDASIQSVCFNCIHLMAFDYEDECFYAIPNNESSYNDDRDEWDNDVAIDRVMLQKHLLACNTHTRFNWRRARDYHDEERLLQSEPVRMSTTLERD